MHGSHGKQVFRLIGNILMFILMLLICVICSFCGKDFLSLGRHSWRCKQRANQANHPNTSGEIPVTEPPKVIISKKDALRCCCGKVCKGARGLKMHQRSCRVIFDLNDELCADLDDLEDDTTNVPENISTPDDENMHEAMPEDHNNFPELRKGIKLPKKDSEWSTANEYFKSALQFNAPIESQGLNTTIKGLNNTVYNYFADNFGYTETLPDENLISKYRDHTVKNLKKALKDLKSKDSDLEEIKYVSRTLRNKLRNNSHETPRPDDIFNHDEYIERSFWGYVKNILNKKNSVLPAFNMKECHTYFTKSLSFIHPNKLFRIPGWIPQLSNPEIEFNLEPPTYQQITAVIRKMKASGSPCPLDQISIISFKRCPFLRTYLTDIIRKVWLSGSIPSEWKQACTILIHKKDDTNMPSNFRPITLQTITLKIFTSCLRNAIYSYLVANNFVEHKIQKGFTPNISGTLEHTAMMANIINNARIKQRSLVITQLDLKNAFGEVHHNLIQSVLDYHHIPEHVKNIVKSLYTNFHVSIITSKFRTPFIPVGRGVLQGDCLSPLLFNMVFNTFIQHIKNDKYNQFGFSFKLLNPIHWFQFADDAVVITSQEQENHFSIC